MDRLKKVLVGIDFSPCCASALAQAVRIASWSQARVAALHVIGMPILSSPEYSFGPGDLPVMDILLDTARARWAGWEPAREVRPKPAFESVFGRAASVLSDRMREDAFDLLVLGAHSELDARKGVGTTAAACVQRAPGRVLVVREAQKGKFTRVVVGIDFSETSRVALEQAVRIAAQDGAALDVLHVYEDPWRGLPTPPGVAAHMPDFPATYRAAVQRHLRSFCEPLAHEINALKGAFHAAEFAGHGKGILEFIHKRGCDLAVLGTRGNWNLRDFFWGSTAERVVRDAPCSVLTVKPPGFGAGQDGGPA